MRTIEGLSQKSCLMTKVGTRAIVPSSSAFLLLVLIIGISTCPQLFAQEGENDEEFINNGCHYTSTFLGAIAGFHIASRSASQVVQAGLAALGGEITSDMLTATCSDALHDYFRNNQDATLTYDEYLEDFCDGDPIRCPDPTLNPNCDLFTPCDGFPAPPHDPWQCTILGCGPWAANLGRVEVSVSDLINVIHFMEASLYVGEWDSDLADVMLTETDGIGN